MKLIKQIFKEVNHDIFGNTLDMPIIVCMHDGEHFGWFWKDSKLGLVININPIYCYDYTTIFGTVAHEMCHIADWIYYKKDWKHLKHDGEFAKMASEIEIFYNLEKGSV